MPASGEFKLSISQALTDQLRAHLSKLTPTALTPANLKALEKRQGVYQLYVGPDLVYVGSAATTLAARLRQHMRKIIGRQNISIEDVSFTCLYVDEDLTVLAPEDRLIKVFKVEGTSPWNFNGFGNKDPGRNRDSSHISAGHFDRLYPIQLDWPCEIEAGHRKADRLLLELKTTLPFLLRYESTDEAVADYKKVEVDVPSDGMTAEALLGVIAIALPDFQVTTLPGYVIIYRESKSYPSGQVIGA